MLPVCASAVRLFADQILRKVNAKNKLFKTNKQQQQRTKTVLATYAVAKKKKIPPKMSLIGVRTQTTALPVQGSNH